MRHIAAYLLASLGSTQPTASTIKSILASVGVEADDKQLAVLIEKLAGKNVEQLITQGSELISTMPSCGGGGSAVAADPGKGAAPAVEEKKEEKKEEPEEESDDDMGFGLFD